MIEYMRAQKAVLSYHDVEKLEVSMGWSWTVDCALVDPVCLRHLQPITIPHPDCIHVWVVNGIVNRKWHCF